MTTRRPTSSAATLAAGSTASCFRPSESTTCASIEYKHTAGGYKHPAGRYRHRGGKGRDSGGRESLRFTFDDGPVRTGRAKPPGAEESMSARLLISGAGTPASNNLIRSLRAGDPSLRIAAFHSDRFVLRRSDADRRYLVPLAGHPAYRGALRRILDMGHADLLIPTSDPDVLALSRLRRKIPCRLYLPRHATIEVCQDKYEMSIRLRKQGIPAP